VAEKGTVIEHGLLRILFDAEVSFANTSGSKSASLDSNFWIWQFAFQWFGQKHEFVKGRSGIQQSLGVRMFWIGEYFFGRSGFYNSPHIHDHDSIGQEPNGGEIVGNIEKCASLLFPDVFQ
jgi:hypothetical protein